MSVVLDTGALLALEKRVPRLVALADEIVRHRMTAYVPAGVVAQAWRGTQRQHAIHVLLRSNALRVVPLDEAEARAVALLLAQRGGSDVVDGHVALVATRTRGPVLTSDPADIRQLVDDVETVLV